MVGLEGSLGQTDGLLRRTDQPVTKHRFVLRTRK